MSQRLDQKVTNKRLAKGKPIDWVCSLCKNYNYSFRVKCKYSIYLGNRCHIQSRDTNHIAAHPIPMKNYDIMEADTKCEVCSGLQFPQMVLVAL